MKGLLLILIINFDLCGNQVGGNVACQGGSIGLNAFGEIYVEGRYWGSIDFNPGVGIFNLTSAGICDVFVLKLDALGNFVWAKSMGGTGYDYGDAMTVDASGNVLTTGSFEGTSDFDPGSGVYNLTSSPSNPTTGYYDHNIFVSKLDANGNFLWAKQVGGVSADACEITALDQAKLDGCQVLVAATGDDKVNLVASLLGKTEYGVPRVVARVNHPKNEWMFDSSWGVDVAVSTPRIISALVEEAVSVGDVVRLFSFRKGEANLVEITLPDTAKCCGKTVSEVELPENASLAAIVRDGHVITPKDHDVFSAGDELLFVASAKAEEKLKSCFI